MIVIYFVFFKQYKFLTFLYTDFLDQKYSKYLRKLPGLSSINDDIYQTYLESHTTTKGIYPKYYKTSMLNAYALVDEMSFMCFSLLTQKSLN